MEIRLTVDATGLSCPLPVLRAKKGIESVESGQVVELLASDKGSIKDIPAWTTTAGHELLEWSEDGGIFRFKIKKK